MTAKHDNTNPLSALPSVDSVLAHPELSDIRLPRKLVADEVRHLIDELRHDMTSDGGNAHLDKGTATANLAREAAETLSHRYLPSMMRVINATGVVLHTGLGRAPLSGAAMEAVASVASAYTNLEVDLETGMRSDRTLHVENLIRSLTGAEAAAVVNNNAAAVLLTLNTVAFGKDCIISRGQQVEIGGSFRMPDVIGKAGVRMVEVGTTNRTHLKDYEDVVTPETGAVLIAHTSNYRIVGFTSAPHPKEIVEIAHAKSVPVIYDLGSGALTRLEQFNLPPEGTVTEALSTGVDLVTFSGDKLIGGPQGGIIVGSAEYVSRCKRNSLMRALRCDKMTIAALEATLRLFTDENTVDTGHRLYSLFSATVESLNQRAETVLSSAGTLDGDYTVKVEAVSGEAGSGSLPTEKIPSAAIVIRSSSVGVDEIASRFRSWKTPVFGYVRDDAYHLDMRTLFEEDLEALTGAIRDIMGSS